MKALVYVEMSHLSLSISDIEKLKNEVQKLWDRNPIFIVLNPLTGISSLFTSFDVGKKKSSSQTQKPVHTLIHELSFRQALKITKRGLCHHFHGGATVNTSSEMSLRFNVSRRQVACLNIEHYFSSLSENTPFSVIVHLCSVCCCCSTTALSLLSQTPG